ncbi:hypothetical protein V1279_003017 [Bradyrhizobium sp. AZCC 1610]|uniref:hypothetical protein n=1 Tax=Bradyrhizobium sp. AZCC 1610 TaxID=3117020 RepID=UPI002FF3F89F
MRLLLFPVLLLLAGCNGSDEPKMVAGQMPACDSKFTRELLVNAIHQSPYGVKVVQVGSIGPLSGDNAKPQTPEPPVEADGQRFCQSHLFTNAGEGDVYFYLKWMDAKKEKVWLQLTVSTI